MANSGVYGSVGSPAPDTGRYQHSACTHTEIFTKGNILALVAIAVVPTRVPIAFCKRSRRRLHLEHERAVFSGGVLTLESASGRKACHYWIGQFSMSVIARLQ
jgi:hypothetical protein